MVTSSPGTYLVYRKSIGRDNNVFHFFFFFLDLVRFCERGWHAISITGGYPDVIHIYALFLHGRERTVYVSDTPAPQDN